MRPKPRKTESEPPQHLQLRLKNFRMFRDSGWLDLASLTCLVGRNSSGKSSIITALLLLKQSMETEIFGSAITPLALSGEYCDLGQFKDLVHDHDESQEISFSFRLPVTFVSGALPVARSPLIEIATPRAREDPWEFHRFYPRGQKFLEKGFLETRMTFSADEPFGPSLSQCEMVFSEIGRVKFKRTISGERRQHWRTYSRVPALRNFVFMPRQRAFFPVVWPRTNFLKTTSGVERRRARAILFACRGFFAYMEPVRSE